MAAVRIGEVPKTPGAAKSRTRRNAYSTRSSEDGSPGVGWRAGARMLIHSRQPELLDAICRGDAFLTPLEGEWCMRFQAERYRRLGQVV